MSSFPITVEMSLPALCPEAQLTCSWAGWWPRLQLTGAGLSGTCHTRSPPVAWPRSDDLVPPPPQCEPPCSEWRSSYLGEGRHVKRYGEARIRVIIMELLRFNSFPTINSVKRAKSTLPQKLQNQVSRRYYDFRSDCNSRGMSFILCTLIPKYG